MAFTTTRQHTHTIPLLLLTTSYALRLLDRRSIFTIRHARSFEYAAIDGHKWPRFRSHYTFAAPTMRRLRLRQLLYFDFNSSPLSPTAAGRLLLFAYVCFGIHIIFHYLIDADMARADDQGPPILRPMCDGAFEALIADDGLPRPRPARASISLSAPPRLPLIVCRRLAAYSQYRRMPAWLRQAFLALIYVISLISHL